MPHNKEEPASEETGSSSYLSFELHTSPAGEPLVLNTGIHLPGEALHLLSVLGVMPSEVSTCAPGSVRGERRCRKSESENKRQSEYCDST